MRTNLDTGDGVIQRKDRKVVNKMSENTKQEEIQYVYVLNKLLPDEIRVLAWTPVSFDFKARYNFHCFLENLPLTFFIS